MDSLITGDVQFYREPNMTWDIEGTDAHKLISENERLKAVRQAVRCILGTERYSNPVFSDDYGCELQQYIGKDAYFLEASIGDVLKDALTHDDRITDVTVDDINETDSETVCVSITVSTIYGDFKEDLNVSLQ